MVGTLADRLRALGAGVRLLRRLGLLDDVDDQGVADQAGAAVLEQRPGAGGW
jgi:hypothetical protein